MDIDLACGRCGSSLMLANSEDLETLSIDLVHRFTQAHEVCGFIAPHLSSSDVSQQNIDTEE